MDEEREGQETRAVISFTVESQRQMHGTHWTILSKVQRWGIILGSRATPQPSYIRILENGTLEWLWSPANVQPPPSDKHASYAFITRRSLDRLSLLGLWSPFPISPHQSMGSSLPQAPAMEAAVQPALGWVQRSGGSGVSCLHAWWLALPGPLHQRWCPFSTAHSRWLAFLQLLGGTLKHNPHFFFFLVLFFFLASCFYFLASLRSKWVSVSRPGIEPVPPTVEVKVV